jgi:hypothetical protein
MNNREMPLILLLAGICLLAAAIIPTLDWLQCTAHTGGLSCAGARNAAIDRWGGNATILLGLAWQDQRRSRP